MSIEGIRSSNGFSTKKTILATVDEICAREDLTRSQVFRRSVMEYLKRQNVPTSTDVDPPEPQYQAWPAELFDLQR